MALKINDTTLDSGATATIQTLGFTGAENSNGQEITVGGVRVVTPVGDGNVSNATQWNALLASNVAAALKLNSSYKDVIIDVKGNTVALIKPFSVDGFDTLSLIKGSNTTLNMTINAPSGVVDGVNYGENPWSDFFSSNFFSPSDVYVNLYTYTWTGGERSRGELVTVGGVNFNLPTATSSNYTYWNSELARLHAEALDQSPLYEGGLVSYKDNGSVLVVPRTFSSSSVTSWVGETNDVNASLNAPSGWVNGIWRGENPYQDYFVYTELFTPTYSISSSSSSVNEGSSVSFTVATTNVASGMSLSYSIYGVSSSDIGGQSLSGLVVVDSNGRATISIPITSDSLTEGAETLTVTVQNQSASVSINDTSRSVATPTYSLLASISSVAEGSSAIFTLSTTNISPGSGVNYTIGGLQASDVVGGELSGSAIVQSDGTARITVPLASDLLTEGTETLYVTVSNQTASMTVLDTSVSQISNSTTNNTTNNITNNNTTNITNNNTTNNTTNINSNNTSTVIDNSTKNIFKNSILNYDASVTNDSSVKQTVFGTLNLFEGSSIDNVIVGTDGVDSFAGQEGNDRFYSSKGNDTYDGGVGLDAVTFNGRVTDFELVREGGNWVIRDLRGSDLSEGTDTLVGVERLGFGDQAVALDFETGESGYNAATLIGAAFGAEKVESYFGIGVQMFDTGSSLQQVSQLIVDLRLIETAIGSDSDSAWVKYVYRNVMGESPDRTTERAFVDLLEQGSHTRADLLALAAGVPAVERQVDIVGSRTKGYVYEPWDDGGGGGGGGDGG